MSKESTNQRRIKRVRINGGHFPSSVLAGIADKVSYAGNGKHKTYPSPNGEWTPSHRPGISKCHQFAEGEWGKIAETLREAIRQGLVQWEQDMPFPDRVWASVNGVLHEARLTNSGTGEYHAFPLTYK